MINSLLTFLNAAIQHNETNSSAIVNEPDGNIIFIIVGVLILVVFYFILNNSKKTQRTSSNRNREVTINLYKLRNKGEYKINIKNTSNSFIEISAPLIILKGFSTSKKVRAKSTNYPLTISPGTNHSFSFRKNQLLNSRQNILNWNLIRVIVNTNYNKNYKSRYWIL